MEDIEGMMEKLQLSAAKKKSVRIYLDPGEKTGDLPTQAVGKLLFDPDPEHIEQELWGGSSVR